ncbi:leucyl aminopeptidase [Francisella frigiditurris]|uniref:Probable cytosol aminopeptidase n=1 Tax=Francisella frigiditurris TaxID=1542390 RepID=A0A1J0KUU8_9GAMM|nr:leucyl aminopeptidase [Francisella frigiditurris]APC97455.1 hypothetical protein KX01_1838 [Francisella frigiditurris]
MKLMINDQSTLATEIVLIFNDDIKKLTDNMKCPTSKALLDQKVFKAKFGEVLPLLHPEKKGLLVGLGESKNFLFPEFHKVVANVCKQLRQLDIQEISININYLVPRFSDVKQLASEVVRNFVSESYGFDALKSEKDTYSLESIEVVYEGSEDLEEATKVGSAIAFGQNYAKDLQNLPANVCTTDYLLNEARELTSKYDKFNLSYLDQNAMAELGMDCALAVGRGSDMSNYTVCMEYNGGGKEDAPIVLVGKGLVFDNGGVCIKPAVGMDSMKMDMGGAATVIGTMKTLAMLDLPINVVGVMALAENAVDARSYRPGDVLKTMKGITVEVSNTDAEGRLVLCDTLTYVEKYKPKVVINTATLTGAMIISLGDAYSGMFANSDNLANSLQNAAQISNDLVWRLPLHKPYLDKVKSDVADINNCGKDRSAGSIVAALFLSKFTENYEWAHLDIAGSAMGDFSNCKASGRPVPLLTHYLLSQVSK